MLIDRLTKTLCQQFQVERVNFELSRTSQWVAFSEEIHEDFTILAYQHGVFPWPMGEEYKIPWVSPEQRGVIFTSEYHQPKSLKKTIVKNKVQIFFNRNFSKVIHYCQNSPTRKQANTWIENEIIITYKKLFEAKQAYCIEVENSDGILMGGLYGVCINGILSGESMFFLETGGSKIALAGLIYCLKKHSIPLLDTQMTTPVVSLCGGREIARDEYLKYVEELNLKQIKREDIFPPFLFYNDLIS